MEDLKFKKLDPEYQERRSRLINAYYVGGHGDMSKQELADKAGYTPEYISRLFSGERKISDDAAKTLAKVLGVREEYLLLKDDYMRKSDFALLLQAADSYAGMIQSALVDEGYLYTGAGTLDLPDFAEVLQDKFISDACSNHERIIVNAEEETFIQLSETEYKEFCDDLSAYIQFKVQRLFKTHEYYYVGENPSEKEKGHKHLFPYN